MDSGSQKGDGARYTQGDRYIQVNLTVNIRDDIWEIVH